MGAIAGPGQKRDGDSTFPFFKLYDARDCFFRVTKPKNRRTAARHQRLLRAMLKQTLFQRGKTRMLRENDGFEIVHQRRRKRLTHTLLKRPLLAFRIGQRQGSAS